MTREDPFLLLDANVLNNSYGEKNQAALQEHETFFSALRICELIDNPMPGDFDFTHLQALHAYIFQGIYKDWAGTIRTVSISKKEKLLDGISVKYLSPGDSGTNIVNHANQLFQDLADKSFLMGLDRSEFGLELSSLLFRLWEIHLFRDGNTRTIMLFCYYLAAKAGYPMSLQFIDKHHRELRVALVLSTQGVDNSLNRIVEQSISDKSSHSIGLWKRLFSQ